MKNHQLDAEGTRIVKELLVAPVKELTETQLEAIERYKKLVNKKERKR